MTEIEKKALALLNECAGTEVHGGWGTFDPNLTPCTRALCRAIEQHEAYKQEVSDVMTYIKELYPTLPRNFHRFIIPKPTPDPLVRVVNEVIYAQPHGDIDEARMAADIREALAKRGLKIVEDV